MILMIIDIHGHYYDADLYPPWVPYGLNPLLEWTSKQDVHAVVTSSLDFFTKGNSANLTLTKLCSTNTKVWQWLVVDPRKPNWWASLPNDKKILGIKVHPTWQQYDLTRYLYDLLEFAKNKKWAILTHSSVSDPFINIKKCCEIADNYPEVPLIFAHLGHEFSGYNDVMNQVDCLRKTKNQNTLIDTSSLAIHLNGILEEAIKKLGSNRILFGTDIPLHFPQSQLARVTMANLTDEAKERILWKTAIEFWPILKGDA